MEPDIGQAALPELTDRKAIQSLILKKRQEMNLTQDKFSQLLGVDRKSVHRWETGETIPLATLLVKIAALTGGEVKLT